MPAGGSVAAIDTFATIATVMTEALIPCCDF